MIYQMEPYIGQEEIDEMADSVKNNWITEGPKAKEFSNKMLEYFGGKYGVLAPNGTLAIYMALKILDLKEGDEVIIPDLTFIATANAVYLTGATPVFVDIKKDDFNIDPSKIENKITEKTKAILPVHLYGQSADMDPILEIAKKYNLFVIEDACQGLGVYYKNNTHVGTIGDIGCFSFFADKTITTGGEGGMVITNDEKVYENLMYFRNQGRLKSGTFLHPQIGYNFRLTDLHGGFGLAQLKKLNYIIEKKLHNYSEYKKHLETIPQVQFLKEMEYSNFVPFRTVIIAERLKELMQCLENNNIQTRGNFYPLHKQEGYKKYNYAGEDFLNANYAHENAMSLPVHLGLTDENIKYICDTIKKLL